MGDLFVPKAFWDPLFENEMWETTLLGPRVGVRSVTMEAWRDGEQAFTRIEAAPSVRITPNGAYIGINSHFQLSTGPESRANGYETRNLLANEWSQLARSRSTSSAGYSKPDTSGVARLRYGLETP